MAAINHFLGYFTSKLIDSLLENLLKHLRVPVNTSVTGNYVYWMMFSE